ncbi:hypothetical protein NQ318_000029, partial [Aromia moschata]
VQMEQRVSLKFLVKLGKTFTEAYAMSKEVYGIECLSRTQVFEWFKRFKEGRETPKDDPRPGRIETLKKLVKSALKGTRFECVEAIKAKAMKGLNQLTEADFQHCFQQWRSCMERCRDHQGEYNEGEKVATTFLGNPKDEVDNNEKSGIYEISCKDCDQKYIGQTKRSILARFKEHMAHLRYGRMEKSCAAQHAFDSNHRIDKNNLKLIRNVTDSRQVDAFESLEIIKCNRSMNKDNDRKDQGRHFKENLGSLQNICTS